MEKSLKRLGSCSSITNYSFLSPKKERTKSKSDTREMDQTAEKESNVVENLLKENGEWAVIDGGLATELESNSADIKDALWSSKCLFSCLELIRKVHLDYLEASASIMITCSYQATIQGILSRGFSQDQSEALLRKNVELAREARDIYLKKCPKKRQILLAASVGSYGAYLAYGSEYSGDYGKYVTLETLIEFYRRRIQVLAEAGPHLIAFETIPNKTETHAYMELLKECEIETPAWFAFSSNDGMNVVRGDSLEECDSIADSCQNCVAIGINCTPPRFIHNLIIFMTEVTKKPILIYPNNGESYDPLKKEWVKSNGVSDEDFVSFVNIWHEAGASLIGGCCQMTPDTIRAISTAFKGGV